MEWFEPWMAVVFFICIAIGWIGGRLDIRQVKSDSGKVPAICMRGISYLLQNERDKALEAFKEVSEVETEVEEFKFALGAIYRERGDIENAIRMHRAILNQEDEGKHYGQAMKELALDYRKSGFLGLAEDTLRELAMRRPQTDVSRELFQIYLLARQWEKAISAMLESKHPDSRVVAHLYCEWADEPSTPREEKGRLLEEAGKANANCGRVFAMQGQLALDRGDREEAIRLWCEVERRQKEALKVVVMPLMQAHSDLGRGMEGETLLLDYLHAQPTPAMFEAVFDAMAEHRGYPVAIRVAEDHLKRFAFPVATVKWLEAKRLLADESERKLFDQLYIPLREQNGGIRHKCSKCSFGSKRFYWKCPACQEWESFLAPGEPE